ncbi:MAG: Ca-activated chloride channel family protein, partial [Polyangiales bacterium]
MFNSHSRRLTFSLFPVAATTLALTVAIACSGHSSAPSEHTTTPVSAAPPRDFGRVDETSAAFSSGSSEDLVDLALAGVSENSSGELGSRFQVRPLRIPATPRGATARFSFDQGKRGWVTALPNNELLASPAYGNGKIFLGGGFASHQFFALDAFGGEMLWSLSAPDGGPTAAFYERDRVVFNTESCTLFVADANTGELLWKKWLGDPLMSQPALAGDLVVSAYPSNGAHLFGAFALADGETEWTTALPADIIQAPQVHGDSSYFSTMDGTVWRVRNRDGHVLWSRDIGASSALWVDAGKVLVTRRVDEGSRHLEEPVVLNASTGATVSRGERAAAAYLAGDSRDRTLAAGQAGAWGGVPHGEHLGLRNVASGWAFQGSSPAVADGRAYFAVGNELRARDIATGETVWTRSDASAGDAQTISPPAVIGSQLVYGTVDGHLYFTDIDTGMTIRAYDVGEPIVFQPIVAQGWVYIATGRGRLIALEIGDAALDGWHMWGGNAQHAGLVENAGEVSPELLASLQRPTRGSLRVAAIETESPSDAEGDVATTEAEETVAPSLLDTELPQISVDVEATIDGFVARVAVTQTFENPHDHVIEAKYLFPLPDQAAVDSMEMHIGSRVVQGTIRRRAQARREYTEARESGRRAALLEQQRPNLFVQRVANIGAHEQIEVRLEYVQTLPFADGAYEFVFPISAPQRSGPSDGASDDMEDDTEGEAQRRANDVAIRVHLEAGLPLTAIDSPSHGVDVNRTGELADVILEAGAATDHDFVLRYAIGGDLPDATVFSERAAVGPDDDGSPNGYFSLLIQPPDLEASDLASVSVTPREVTFVLDRSSSMRGAPMNQARAVMERVIASLDEEDSLNVLTFSDDVEGLADVPLPADSAHRAAALAMVSELHTVGSTHMVPAVQSALRARGDDESRLRIVVLLTDGYIGNEADVLRAIASDLGDARLYALGVGSAVNRFLLDRAAEVGRGSALFASLGEDPSDVGARFAELIARPVFTDVEIDWGGLDVQDIYPRRTPDLFAGRPLVLHGRFNEGGSARVRIRGTLNGQRHERSLTVQLQAARGSQSAKSQATLWARAAVKDRMSRLTLRDDSRLIEEVTRLGLRHSIVTQWTSFVAVESRQVEEAEAPRTSISPSRSMPGDPEVRIPAPMDAREVTLIL